MSTPDINFRNIRKHRNSQNDGFEELTRQLVLAEPPANVASIENRGPGADGGVEILARFPDGRVWGWQSKYFPDAFGSSEVGQLKKSFKAALTNFPALERYYVAVPRNFSGHAEGDNDTQTKQWQSFKKWCAAEAKKLSRTIDIQLWDESYFVSKLQCSDPIYAGMRLYWFDDKVLDGGWFEHQLKRSLEFIGKRYRPEDHVSVRVGRTMDVLRRDSGFHERWGALLNKFSEVVAILKTLRGYKGISPIDAHCDTLRATLEDMSVGLSNCDVSDLYASRAFQLLQQLEAIRIEDTSYNALMEAQFERVKAVDPKTGKETFEPVYSYAIRGKIGDLASRLSTAATEFSLLEAKLLKQPVLLIDGEAGIGKSHLLANEAEVHLQSGGPALFIPARVLDHGDKPEQELLRYLDVADLRFETFLAALHSAALASGKPALLLIDGINESLFAKGWEAGLPSLLTQIKRFHRIGLAISIRSSYRELCIRAGLDIPQITHHGFRGHLGEAAKEYLDRNGIERPSAPIFGLNEILYNPLFLSTAVDFMKSTNQTSFPRGLDSISTLITFWLGAVEQNIIAKGFERISLKDGKIPRIMRKLASEMAAAGSEYIAYEKAHKICEEIVDLAPPSKESERLLSRLIDEGLLLDFPSDDTETGKRISFGFQKFGDYFIADAILRDTKNAESLAIGLRNGGKYEYLFSEERYYEFAGPRVALMATTPARFGCEIPAIDETFIDEVSIRIDEFLESLLWRQADAITSETVDLLHSLREAHEDEGPQVDDEKWFDLLIQLAPLPNCLMNASYLKAQLAAMPLGERDASWSAYLVGKMESYGDDDWSPVQQLVDWAWIAPKAEIEPEKVHQVALTLALMTSTTDRRLRDSATKALSSLFMKFPDEIGPLVTDFADWDDSYVRERVLAAACSGVLFCDDPAGIKAAAIAADQMVFQKQPIERHAWTRRYAQIIINHAMSNSVGIDGAIIKRSSPPYNSLPITNWPTLEELAPLRESARSIFNSVIGFVNTPFDGKPPMMAGDFGRYTMGGIDNSFSEIVRGKFPPLQRKEEVELFWKKVAKLGQPADAAKADLMHAADLLQKAELAVLMKNLDISEDEDTGLETNLTPIEVSLEEQHVLAEEAFLGTLPKKLKEDYKRVQPLNRYKESGIPKFQLLKGQCWVFKRTLELGWKQSLHEDVEKNQFRYSHGRHDHQVERIGKKYQHIAFAELVGYLADYHWYVDWDKNAEILKRLEDFQRPDIDATYLSGEFSKPVEKFLPGEIRLPQMEFLPDTPARNMDWAKTLDGIPEPTQFFVQSDANGVEWCLVRSFRRSKDYMKELESSAPFRSAQYGIELLLVPKQDLKRVEALTTAEIRNNDHDVFDNHWSSPQLFGMRSFRHIAGVPQFELNYTAAKFKFGRLTESFSPKYSEYDASGVYDESDASTPHAALLSELRLRPKSAWANFFVTDDGAPAFCDRPEFLAGATIIRRDLIEAFAAKHELTPVWRVWVEKDGGLGTSHHSARHDQFARHDFIGYFFCTHGVWKGRLIPYRS